MYKIAVMGDRESILSFKALGIETVSVENNEEAKAQISRLAQDEYAVVYLTEQLAVDLKQEIEKYADKIAPAFILIPGPGGSLGIGMANAKDAVERAVGADILGS